MTTESPPKNKYKPEQWIAENQVFIDSYGWCWGIVPHTLENQCLGREEDVKNTLATGVIPKNQCGHARIILQGILDDIENQKKQEDSVIFRQAKPRKFKAQRRSRKGAKH